jgi:hypothetical protein
VYAGVALTTAATLILELALTRIFSVVFYYHFAFLAVSIALFGLGAGGVLSYYAAARGIALYRRLGALSAANAVLVVLTLASVLSLGSEHAPWELAVLYFGTALPFIGAGIVLSSAIAETIERVDRVYFWDLAGAAAGCLLLIPFLNIVGGPGAVVCAAVLYASSSAVWFWLAKSVRMRSAGVALALALVALVIYNQRAHLLDLRSAKGQSLGQEIFVQWNSFSRISIRGGQPHQPHTVVIDADATTDIPRFDLNRLSPEQMRELSTHGPAFPYLVRPGAKALVLGAGGGWDVARAISSGSRDVTAVEINPIIADTIMRGRFLGVSHGLYRRPEVRVHVEDGRSFVRRSTEQYQVLQATLVDTWASTAAGAFALSENNLYTVEAFHDYLTHLTPDGFLAFTRWGFEPPRESLRLLSLARTALTQLGEPEAWRHVAVVREDKQRLQGWGATDTVLISRKPFPAEDLRRIREAAAQGGFEVIYLPGEPTDSAFARLLRTASPEDFFRSYRYNVAPVTDDQPFFFYTVQPRDLFDLFLNRKGSAADVKINLALPTLFSVFSVSIAATLITLLLPPLVLKSRLPSGPGTSRFLLYFVCLGAGYVLVQMSMIQKLVLLLGHPTYALTVVIFSMLVASGAGSYFSRRLAGPDGEKLPGILVTTFVLLTALAFAAPFLIDAAARLPLVARLGVAVLLISPPAFFMGMPFPTGLSVLERWHPTAVRWAWSLNAAASVLGSAAAIFSAIYLGLRSTTLAGAALYLLALWCAKARSDSSARA